MNKTRTCPSLRPCRFPSQCPCAKNLPRAAGLVPLADEGAWASGLYDLIHDLGFVQVDSIQWVERAHHQILFSRNQTYRPKDLQHLIEKNRSLFEHWTHDASVIPSEFFPYWKHRFVRREAKIRENWAKWQGQGFDQAFEETYARIRITGRSWRAM